MPVLDRAQPYERVREPQIERASRRARPRRPVARDHDPQRAPVPQCGDRIDQVVDVVLLADQPDVDDQPVDPVPPAGIGGDVRQRPAVRDHLGVSHRQPLPVRSGAKLLVREDDQRRRLKAPPLQRRGGPRQGGQRAGPRELLGQQHRRDVVLIEHEQGNVGLRPSQRRRQQEQVVGWVRGMQCSDRAAAAGAAECGGGTCQRFALLADLTDHAPAVAGLPEGLDRSARGHQLADVLGRAGAADQRDSVSRVRQRLGLAARAHVQLEQRVLDDDCDVRRAHRGSLPEWARGTGGRLQRPAPRASSVTSASAAT